MYCPNCKSEYRAGFTRCSDCDAGLVEQLITDDEIECRTVWKGDSQLDCVESCKDLRETDIPYRVSQTPMGFSGRMAVDFHYEIEVSKADYARAMEILRPEEDPLESIELPASDSAQISPERGDHNSSYPSGPAVEIFSQSPKDHSSIVELSLKTNYIDFQTQTDEDGTRRIFVAPEDESLAREIVREIRDGRPPE